MSSCPNCFIKLIRFIVLFIFSCIIIFYFPFVILDSNYEKIDIYIEAIEKTWNNYPILDISLTRKFGYKEIILMGTIYLLY